MPVRPPAYRPPHVVAAQQAGQSYETDRGNERERGYTKRLRNAMGWFKVHHPLCLGCEAVGRLTPTEVTDHIIPAKGDHVLLWDQDNWQACCRWHHDVIKQRLEHLYAKGQATASDLRLDSARAIELTKQEAR